MFYGRIGKANAALAESARQHAVARISRAQIADLGAVRGRAVEVEDVSRFVAQVRDLGDCELHARREFVASDTGCELCVASKPVGVAVVEPPQELAGRGVDRGRDVGGGALARGGPPRRGGAGWVNGVHGGHVNFRGVL